MRFEVLFERNSLVFGPKSNGNLNLPRSKLGRVRTLAGIMFFESCFKVFGYTYVVPLMICKATKCVYIIEHTFAGLPRRSPLRLYMAE